MLASRDSRVQLVSCRRGEAGSGWEEATAESAGGRLAVLVRDPLVALRTGHEMQNLQRLVLGLASWSLPFSSLHLRTCWS